MGMEPRSSEEVEQLKKEIEALKLKAAIAEARTEAVLTALVALYGPDGQKTTEMVMRMAAALLSRGGF